MSRNMCTSATYCVGIAERSGVNDLLHSQAPYLNVAFN